MVSFRTGCVSVTGNVRENNEDSCRVDDQNRFVIVADGMGGQSAGERASALAVELIPRRLEQLLDFQNGSSRDVNDAIAKAIVHANSEIMALSEVEPGLRNMGTTVVMMVRCRETFYFFGIGDSRAYELRNGRLKQLTTDHSLTQALLDAGTITAEDARNHRYKNVLYRYLGTRDGSAAATVVEVTPKSGDRFLLCSDGLNDGIDNETIAGFLRCDDDPQTIARNLVNAALEGGSRDNITCIVICVD